MTAVYADVAGFFGYVPGTITHLYHGAHRDRHYVARWHYLTNGLYDPVTDVEVDDTGLLAWTDYAKRHKSDMVRLVSDYFALRREDD
jgi:hypothetical protein